MSNKNNSVRFIQHLISLVLKEKDVDTKANQKLLSGSAHQLEKRGVAILNLQIADILNGFGGYSNLVLEAVVGSRRGGQLVTLQPHKITMGDIVALMAFDPYNDERNTEVEWSGIVAAVSKTRIIISGNEVYEDFRGRKRPVTELPYVLGSCKIVKLPNNVSHERVMKALAALMMRKNSWSKSHQILLGLDQPTEITEQDINQPPISFFDNSLNQYQKDAVNFCLDSREIALIHGPPGTGKTHTLIEIIRQLVSQKMRVLVCGPSNVSVDNLVERTAEHCNNIVRVGHPARVANSSIAWTLEVLCCGGSAKEAEEYIKNLMRTVSINVIKSRSTEKAEMSKTMGHVNKYFKFKTIRRKQIDKLNSASVVFSTLNGAGSAMMKESFFDVVIIDEAGQATEPDCWVALNKSGKAILAGDHLQLPPTVLSATFSTSSRNHKGMSLLNDLTYTLFDRLLSMYGDKIKRLLSIQYRMNRKIMEFSSLMLYENRLIAHVSVADHLLHDLPSIKKSVNTLNPVIMIDTKDTGTHHEVKGSGQFDKQSTANSLEVKIIAHQIKKLLEDGVKQQQISVITPYKAQVSKIRTELGEKWLDIEVGTVDGFQGKEKEVILLSLVRSNQYGEVGFLAEKRRLNVAMTRAKRQLVVVCDSLTLNGSLKRINLDNNKSLKTTTAIDSKFLEEWVVWLEKEAQLIQSKIALQISKPGIDKISKPVISKAPVTINAKTPVSISIKTPTPVITKASASPVSTKTAELVTSETSEPVTTKNFFGNCDKPLPPLTFEKGDCLVKDKISLGTKPVISSKTYLKQDDLQPAYLKRVDSDRVSSKQIDSTHSYLKQVDADQVGEAQVDPKPVYLKQVNAKQVGSKKTYSKQVHSNQVDVLQMDSRPVYLKQGDSEQDSNSACVIC